MPTVPTPELSESARYGPQYGASELERILGVNELFAQIDRNFVRLSTTIAALDPEASGAVSMARDPNANDDNTANYRYGSIVVNTVTDQPFVCVDAATGAADWQPLQLMQSATVSQWEVDPTGKFVRLVVAKPLELPTFTTEQRDALNPLPDKRLLIYNSDTNQPEVHNGVDWGSY